MSYTSSIFQLNFLQLSPFLIQPNAINSKVYLPRSKIKNTYEKYSYYWKYGWYGKLAAIEFAKKGYSVYIHGRNKEKVQSVISEIKTISNNASIDGFVADVSDLKAVKNLASEINQKLDKIDVLINNAGIFKSPQNNSSEGYDIRFVVNYLAPYLLTQQLLPLISKTNSARIINLSSAAQSEISYNAMVGKAPVNVNSAYAQSKLALTMWSRKLSNDLPNTVVLAVNPGSLLNTKMANEACGQHWSPAEKGSQILVELSELKQHENYSGAYFDNDAGKYAKAHPHVYATNEIDQLIKFTQQILDRA